MALVQKEWKAPDGKVVPYQQEIIELTGNEDESEESEDDSSGTYYLEINIFPKNTKLSFIKESWDSAEGDGQDPLLVTKKNLWKTLPNQDWLEQRDELLKEAEALLVKHQEKLKPKPRFHNLPEVIGPDEYSAVHPYEDQF